MTCSHLFNAGWGIGVKYQSNMAHDQRSHSLVGHLKIATYLKAIGRCSLRDESLGTRLELIDKLLVSCHKERCTCVIINLCHNKRFV